MEDIKRDIEELLNQIADELNISNTMYEKACQSYEAVGKWLSDCEPNLGVIIRPQGSLYLGLAIKPISDKDEYDIDLVCILKKGVYLSAKSIKQIVGDRLKENEKYKHMLEKEGKRCWTLQYAEFHMDILPCVPKNGIYIEDIDTELRLTHKISDTEYIDKYSNPYEYRKWFESNMEDVFMPELRTYAKKNNVDVSEVPRYIIRTPLQKAIQLLKRHRDIMFAEKYHEDAPISIIITTLAALAYNNESNIYDTLSNILDNMDKYIEKDSKGNFIIKNPVMADENFANKWNKYPIKARCFEQWVKQAKKDLVITPLTILGRENMAKHIKKVLGENITNKAYISIAERYRHARENQSLYVNGLQGGISTNDSGGKKVKGHTFFGKE